MGCEACGGAGYVVTCPDDMCRGVGECRHGDGEDVCSCSAAADATDGDEWDDDEETA